jgi:O-acetyl-ADP-ribose deacetylase (regulator of RNase III)
VTAAVKTTIGTATLELIQGDLTDLDTDALVNAANDRLQLGGGVAGAIARRGGPSIQEECDRIGGTPVGTAVATGAGRLRARHVIHAVGPRMGEGEEDRKLADATRAVFDVAERLGLASVALPAVSTGIFGFPIERCARIMLGVARERLARPTALRRVVFCLFDTAALGVFEAAWHESIGRGTWGSSNPQSGSAKEVE